MPMPEIVSSEVVWPQVPQLLLIDHSSMGAWFQSTPPSPKSGCPLSLQGAFPGDLP